MFKNKSDTALYDNLFSLKERVVFRGVKCFIDKEKKSSTRTSIILFSFVLVHLFARLDDSLFGHIQLSLVCYAALSFFCSAQEPSFHKPSSSTAVLIHSSPSFFSISPTNRPGSSPLIQWQYSEQKKKA